MLTVLHLRVWYNTAKQDGSALLDNTKVWFDLRIKKGTTTDDVDQRLEIVDIAEFNL